MPLETNALGGYELPKIDDSDNAMNPLSYAYVTDPTVGDTATNTCTIVVEFNVFGDGSESSSTLELQFEDYIMQPNTEPQDQDKTFEMAVRIWHQNGICADLQFTDNDTLGGCTLTDLTHTLDWVWPAHEETLTVVATQVFGLGMPE